MRTTTCTRTATRSTRATWTAGVGCSALQSIGGFFSRNWKTVGGLVLTGVRLLAATPEVAFGAAVGGTALSLWGAIADYTSGNRGDCLRATTSGTSTTPAQLLPAGPPPTRFARVQRMSTGRRRMAHVDLRCSRPGGRPPRWRASGPPVLVPASRSAYARSDRPDVGSGGRRSAPEGPHTPSWATQATAQLPAHLGGEHPPNGSSRTRVPRGVHPVHRGRDPDRRIVNDVIVRRVSRRAGCEFAVNRFGAGVDRAIGLKPRPAPNSVTPTGPDTGC